MPRLREERRKKNIFPWGFYICLFLICGKSSAVRWEDRSHDGDLSRSNQNGVRRSSESEKKVTTTHCCVFDCTFIPLPHFFLGETSVRVPVRGVSVDRSMQALWVHASASLFLMRDTVIDRRIRRNNKKSDWKKIPLSVAQLSRYDRISASTPV